ncbi:MAG: CocE/NonD family hydrolase [Patulibacter sp.]|nr:CocE/NonD family hydrolase [Patulibacter sp.]
MARPRLALLSVLAATAAGISALPGTPAAASGISVSVGASVDLTVPGLPPIKVPGIPKLPTAPGLPKPTTPSPTTPTLPTTPPVPGGAANPLAPILAPTKVQSNLGPAATYDPGPEKYGETISYDVPITMRDGVVLRGDVHMPTDLATGQPAAGPFPVILSETPYGKQLGAISPTTAELTGYEPALVKRGYIQLIVDVRGTGGSEGNFDLLSPTEQKDSVQVIDYASTLPHSTGKVGMLGLSYVGITQLLAAENVGPNSPLKAILPIMATNDPYRELASDGGLLNLASTPAYAELVNAASTLNPSAQLPRAPLYGAALTGIHGIGSTYWSASTIGKALLGQDEAYDQSYWRARSPGAHLDQIVKNGVAAFLIGGSYDVFQSGELLNFVGLQNAAAGLPTTGPLQSGQPLTGKYQLLVGPWYHMAHFDQIDLQRTELAWFDHWLKGVDTGLADTTQPLHVIEPSGGRYDTGQLPLANSTPTKLYLGKAQLRTAPPTGKRGADAIAWSGASIACNRSSEQWFTGLPNQGLNAIGLQDPCATNRPATPDSPIQRSYTTAPVASDTRIAGPGTLTLAATATTKDAEFIATLQDVDPKGNVTDLTGGSLLGSHRAVDTSQSWLGAGGDPLLTWHPYTKAAKQPVVPGKLTRFDVPLRPIFTTLPAGHRLRVVITTSELPHVIAIPEDLKNLVGGVYAIQRNAAAASFLQLPLGPAS